MKIESVDSSLVGIPQTETDASEATVFLDYDTDTELEDDLFASISVSILDSGEAPPVNVLQGKMFPKDASLLTSVRAVLFGSEQRRLKIENIKDRCFVANKLHSREEWMKVKADDWKSELSHFVSPKKTSRTVVSLRTSCILEKSG
uniref:DDE_Tnp_1_7 domain-containing protein n=1 Tax=Steinernema glaseri TaxID=37863 RepID=A0A1I7ZZV9_9BILA